MLSETVDFIHYHSTSDSGIQSSRDVFKPSTIFSSSACVRFFCIAVGSDLLSGMLITPYYTL